MKLAFDPDGLYASNLTSLVLRFVFNYKNRRKALFGGGGGGVIIIKRDRIK